MSSFLVDISGIKSCAGGVVPVDLSGKAGGRDYQADVRLVGTALNEGGPFTFKGSVTGVIRVCCARCLSDVELHHNSEIEFSFVNSAVLAEEEAGEALVFSGNVVDFGEAVEGVLRADMPIAALCREDCKGLCAVCGRDLNTGGCGCEKAPLNPVIDINNFLNNLK